MSTRKCQPLPYDGKPGPITLGPDSTLEDFQAIADIVSDHIGLNERNNYHCVYYNGSTVWPIIDKEVERQGRARYKTGKITVGGWTKENKYRLIQHIVHEVCHFHISTSGHNASFKRLERKTLKELFGIGIEYNKAYCARLYDLETGETLFSKLARFKEKYGDSKDFKIGQKVKINNGQITATVKRRNKKTVTIEWTVKGNFKNYTCTRKVYPKNLEPVSESRKLASAAEKSSEN